MKNFVINFKFCFELLMKSNMKNFLLIVIANIITIIISIINLFFSKNIINNIIYGLKEEINFKDLAILIILYFVILIIISSSEKIITKLSTIQMQSLESHIKTELMKISVDIDIAYFDLPDHYDKIAISRDNALSLYQIVFSSIATINCIVTVLVTFIISIRYSLLLTSLTLIIVLPIFIIKRLTAKNIYDFDKKQYRDLRRNKYINMLLFSHNAAKEVRFYNIGSYLIDKYQKTTEELVSSKIYNTRKNSIYNSLSLLPYIMFNVIIKLVIVLKILIREITIGDYILLTGILNQLYSNISALSDYYSIFISYNEKINDFKNYFLLNKSNVREGNIKLKDIKKIEFKNIHFTYPGTDKKILNNISFIIYQKEKVMIVGSNGSGKTTLIKLLTRFYQPDEGEILINDKNIEQYTLESVRKAMSIVFQDFQIYDMSLKENIVISDIDNSNNQKKVLDALKYSTFSNKEISNNEDLEIEISKRFDDEGIILSGGQRQKLAIARALFRDTDFIVMDEPTSSLDPIAERDLLNLYKEVYKYKTLIIVSHRLLNAAYMDKIILLVKDEMCVIGTHLELYQKNVIYKELFNLQKNKFQDENEREDKV